MDNLQLAILFLDRSGFDFYTPTQESTIRYNFPQEIFRDMEIINTDQFLAQITAFITTYSIPPSNITILLSNSLLFFKDLSTTIPSSDPNTPPQTMSDVEQQKQTQQFLDTVPFEAVESKTYPIDGGVRIVATNKTLYDTIRMGFEKEGSWVKSVVPAFVVSASEDLEGLTEDVITTVINNTQNLASQSFSVHPEEKLILTKEEKKKQFMAVPKATPKMYAMIGGFVLLIGVFGFMVKQMMDSNAQINAKAPTPTPAPVVAAAAPPAATSIPLNAVVVSGTPAVVNHATIKVQITTTAATATQGQLIKNKLTQLGYTNVILLSNTAPTSAKTLVTFSSTLDPAVQTDITSVIKNIYTTYSTEQTTQSQYDVIIVPSSNL